MNPFFLYIRAYYQHAYHRLYFLSVCIFMGLFIYFNYRHLLEAGLAAEPSEWKRFGGYYLMYLVPFAFTFLLQYAFFGWQQYYRNAWFWIIVLLAPAFFSIQVNANLHELIFPEPGQSNSAYIFSQCFKWLTRSVLLLLPAWFIWRIKDRKTQPFYGTALVRNFRPYLVLILVMLPLITIASFQPAFREIYPRAQFIREMDVSHKTLYFLFYELCYGSEFLGVEFFFRGFLVLSLIRICGQQSLLPIACFYCAIHFGKPVAEAISSLLGGLLLGIISYHTRSIRGVLILHLGMAWMMEIIGWLAGS